ncbi:MAG: exo-alpha-sialidase [Planctomycetaceae bacterium]|nr:exo-alpha-sialidase [Planctomycetaceae bacterium]
MQHMIRLTMIFSFMCGLFLLLPGELLLAGEKVEPLAYTITMESVLESKPETHAWFHPRVAAMHGVDGSSSSEVMMTFQKLLPVSDYFSGLSTMQYSTQKNQWGKLLTPPELGWIADTDNVDIAVADVTPVWHPQLQKVIAVGAQVRYNKKGHQLDDEIRAHQTAFAVYDPKTKKWTPWKRLQMPADAKFNYARSACAQWLVEPNGDLLLPFYIGSNSKDPFSVSVVRCTFDGADIHIKEQGNELKLNIARGVYEPSLTKFQNRYYLTLRNDIKGYVTSSDDGMNFAPIKPWTFDDGKELGSYNTQQHWISHSDGLFLVYTRRAGNNDHIMRHRAPLFMAQVDPQNLTVLRATEKIVVPEKGAMLGNFGAAEISSSESWITVGERRDYKKIPKEKWTSNFLYVVKIKWEKPNRAINTK